MTLIPVTILLIVFILIAVRKFGRFRIQIWQAMLFGALAVLLTGQIKPITAFKSINPDVMLFLFGMFVVGTALEESGYLSRISCKLFDRAKTRNLLLLLLIFGAGIGAAFLMNDTIAIIGTPIVLFFSKRHGIPAKPLLLALAFAITLGSVASPIGNPQNLLIAVNGGFRNPFAEFASAMIIPTIVNLLLAYCLIRLYYPGAFSAKRLVHVHPGKINDERLAFLSKTALVLMVALVLVKVALVFVVDSGIDVPLTAIACVSAAPILLFSRKRLRILKGVDWTTLVFFASMFVLMESVWQSGFFQAAISGLRIELTSIPMILLISILLSQLISNVPLVALYMPLLMQAGVSKAGLVALAAGSTIAGNLFILGAASNVIIIQNAEKKSGSTLTFWEFARIGIPLTFINAAVYWLFLHFFRH